MKTKVRITRIHVDKNGIAHASLVEAENGRLCVSATLLYILESLKEENTPYDCVNAHVNSYGEYVIY